MGRHSKAGAIDDLRGQVAAAIPPEVSARAAELAVRAADAAREAQKAAAPVVRQAVASAADTITDAQRVAAPVVRSAASTAAETLSEAAEKAAEVLADTADRLAQRGSESAGAASVAARHQLADAAEAFAGKVRPRKRRRVRRVLFVGAAIGAAIAVVNLRKRKQAQDLDTYGATEPPASIPLPSQAVVGRSDAGPQAAAEGTEAEGEAAAAAAAAGSQGNGVVSGRTGEGGSAS
jgi:hypothetical protein